MEQSDIFQIGQTVADRYDIKGVIVQANTSIVYDAFDRELEFDVALKLMHPQLTQTQASQNTFIKQASLASHLNHPNIVPIFDLQQEGGLCFLTLDVLEGQGLRQLMDNRTLVQQPFSQDEVIELLTVLTGALNYAHDTIVHGDIKPENIYLTEQGDYKLMDFGLASVMSSRQRTSFSVATGTGAYVAPELITGRGDVDPRSDQYSLAVLAYELLSGDLPMHDFKPLHESVQGISKPFSLAVQKALSAQAEHRFKGLDEFIHALQQKKTSLPSLPTITLPRLPVKKLAIAATVFIAVFGAYHYVNKVGFDTIIQALTPINKEVLAQQQTLMSEAKRKQTLLVSLRDKLTHDISDAEKSNNAELNGLLYWQGLSENTLFGEQFETLNKELLEIETMVEQGDYQEAVPQLTKINPAYQTLLDDFALIGQLYLAQETIKQHQAQWTTLKEQHGLTEPKAISEAQTLQQQADNEVLAGDFTSSLARYATAAKLLETNNQLIEAFIPAKEEAEKSHAAWLAYSKQEKLTNNEDANAAQVLLEQTNQAQGAGDLTVSLEQYQQAHTSFIAVTEQAGHVVQARNTALQAQAEWQKMTKAKKLEIANGITANTVIDEGNAQLESGDFALAITSFERAIPLFEQAKGEAEQLLAVKMAKESASKAENKWKRIAKAYGVTADEHTELAMHYKAAASEFVKNNDFAQALVNYQQAEEKWKDANKRVAKEVVSIKQIRLLTDEKNAAELKATQALEAVEKAQEEKVLLAKQAKAEKVKADQQAARAKQKELIHHAQGLLKELGYAVGAVDGKASATTIASIKQFQQSQNQGQTGVIDKNLIAMLEQEKVAQATQQKQKVAEETRQAKQAKTELVIKGKVFKFTHQDKAPDESQLDIKSCDKEGTAAARTAKVGYVDHGGCWCKITNCDWGPMCQAVANYKIKKCLIKKGWTLDALN